MHCRLGIILLFASLTLPLSASAESRIDCDALNSRILKHPVHYCVYLPAGYDAGSSQHPAQKYPVLYFLHGLGDNERTLFNSGGWTMLDDRGKGERYICVVGCPAASIINSRDQLDSAVAGPQRPSRSVTRRWNGSPSRSPVSDETR